MLAFAGDHAPSFVDHVADKTRAEGKVKRANAEQELGRIEGELRQKMLEINN